MNKKSIFRNIVASFMLQIVTIISGFVIPKIIISEFGSQTNGLITSITQFLNYVSLLEGGLSGVVMASLYKPLADNNFEKVSGIVNASQRFFRQIAVIYAVYVAVVAAVYPVFVESGYSYSYVFALVGVLAINLFIQYFFSLSYKLLLNADQKVYFVSVTQIFIVLANMLFVVAGVKVFNDVLVIKLISAAVFVIQPVMYTRYVKRHYNIDKCAKADNEALSQRWNGFGQNLAYFIHVNTDVVILTVFLNLTMVSVYSVYLMIANALKVLVVSISSAIAPSLGSILAKGDNEAANQAFDIYEFGMSLVTTLLFTCGIVLVVPFVGIYTSGITDANYIQPVFAVILMLAEMVYCFRDPYVSIIYAAGHFKQTAKYSYAEAALNILISVVLVRRYGVIGVAAGTLVSMVYRMITQIVYLKQHILYRPITHFIKKAAVFGLTSLALCIAANRWLLFGTENYFVWAANSIVIFVFCFAVILGVSMIFFKKELKMVLKRRR